MEIDNFLKQYVEGYLFHDLKSMAAIQVPPGQDCGACGYPMVLMTLTGMELLGGLISSSTFSDRAGNGYFCSYWTKCLANGRSRYKIRGLASLVYDLVRNGLAHTSVAKPGIVVYKGRPELHLKRITTNPSESLLGIDAVQLYKDFEDSYYRQIGPIFEGSAPGTLTTKPEMQTRLDDMIRIYSDKAAKLFGEVNIGPATLEPGPSEAVRHPGSFLPSPDDMIISRVAPSRASGRLATTRSDPGSASPRTNIDSPKPH